MSILHESIVPPKILRKAKLRGFFIEKEYNLLDPEVASPPLPTNIDFGWFTGGSIKKDAYVNVTWDEAKTILHQPLLRWTAHSWRAIGSISAMEARMYVNDVVVSARGWTSSEGGCIIKGNPAGLNIGAHLKNGRNKFSLELVRSWEAPSSGIDAIYARLAVQFTGKEPGVKAPPPEWWPYLKYGLIGIGAIAAVAVTVPLIREWRRKS